MACSAVCCQKLPRRVEDNLKDPTKDDKAVRVRPSEKHIVIHLAIITGFELAVWCKETPNLLILAQLYAPTQPICPLPSCLHAG